MPKQHGLAIHRIDQRVRILNTGPFSFHYNTTQYEYRYVYHTQFASIIIVKEEKERKRTRKKQQETNKGFQHDKGQIQTLLEGPMLPKKEQQTSTAFQRKVEYIFAQKVTFWFEVVSSGKTKTKKKRDKTHSKDTFMVYKRLFTSIYRYTYISTTKWSMENTDITKESMFKTNVCPQFDDVA